MDHATVPVLDVRDLTVSFPGESGRVQAVRGVSYSVRPGQVLGVVGESGSGKSVTSLAVMGLLPASARVGGSVRLDGRELLDLDDRAMSHIRGNRLAMVFQDPLSALTPVYTVGEQIAETIRVHQGLARAKAAARAAELLDLVGIPDAARRAGAYPHEFSGGMRQRVVIAMAVANDPDVIIADEPTTALDVTVQAQILDVFRTAREATGAALVLVTHDLGVVAGVADEVMVMYAGAPVEVGPAERVFAAPRMPYTIGLLGSVPRLDAGRGQPLTPVEGSPPPPVEELTGCAFAPRCPLADDDCRAHTPALTDLVPGHAAACHHTEATATGRAVFPEATAPPTAADRIPRADRAVVLDVSGLHRHYGGGGRGLRLRRRSAAEVRAVDGVDLEIRSGETLGLVGESGCGKTTTVMEILRLRAPQAGGISLLGQSMAELTPARRQELRSRIQVVFQDPAAALDPRMPVHDIVAEPLTTRRLPREEADRRVRELLRLVGLDPEVHLARYPGELSGGQRQRVGIARSLALDPALLVLDEPVSALDVSVQAGVLNLLDRLKAELGLAYLFVSHDLSVVRHLADRIAVMYLGRIVESGDADAVFERPSHPYTRALLSAVPIPDPAAERSRRRVVLSGDLPAPTDVPGGCRFRPRCPLYAELDPARASRCASEDPVGRELGVDGVEHVAACHHAG